MLTSRCSSRSPSGRPCDQFDGHDGDHHSADARAWATPYGQRPTAVAESVHLAARPAEARPIGLRHHAVEEVEARINSTLQSISQVQVELAAMKRALRAASALPTYASAKT